MPARKAAPNKTNRKTANASKAKPATVVEKAVKEKPTITTTENSSPEEILHSSWTFLSLVQFFAVFRPYFQLPTVTIEKLERALLNSNEDSDGWSSVNTPPANQDDQDRSKRESSILSTASSQPDRKKESKYLQSFLTLILSPLLKTRQRQLSLDQQIAIVFPEYKDTPFTSLNIMDKIRILKRIQDLHMESDDEKFIAFKNENQADNLRVEALGSDHEGWVYWYFGDTRLYREIPIPYGKRGNNLTSSTDFTFQLVCSTEQEWHETVKAFQNSRKSRELYAKICEIGLEVIAKLEAREATRIRNEAKLKRAKELELIPKKRSSRLEAKQEEEAKRQKLMEIARQQAELEEIERKDKAKQAKKLAEQEKQEVRTEEARLRYDTQDYVTKLLNDGLATEAEAKEFRTQIKSGAIEYERLHKMQGWIRLLDKDVHVVSGSEDNLSIQFTGDFVHEALQNVLFKNAVKSYLMSLMTFFTAPPTQLYKKIDSIYKNLVLNRYQSLDEFSSEFNNALQNEEIQYQSINLLRSIFDPAYKPIEETEDMEVDIDVDVKAEDSKMEEVHPQQKLEESATNDKLERQESTSSNMEVVEQAATNDNLNNQVPIKSEMEVVEQAASNGQLDEVENSGNMEVEQAVKLDANIAEPTVNNDQIEKEAMTVVPPESQT